MLRRALSRLCLCALIGAAVWLAMSAGVRPRVALAHDEDDFDLFPDVPGSGYVRDTCSDHHECGQVGPLIPMPYTAVGSGLIWTDADWDNPKLHFKGRHSDVTPADVFDEACMEELILGSGFSAWPIPSEEWAAQWPDGSIDPNPDVLARNIFKDGDPVKFTPFSTVENSAPSGNSFNRCMRSSFKHLMYGGYRLRQGQSPGTAFRIRAYMNREGAQVWDLSHPSALLNTGKRDTVLLDEADALLNLDSFTNAGRSRGLYYDLYSLGYGALPDGRIVHVGGHANNSNAGLRKLNIYNPNTNTWDPRPEPCQNANWAADRYGRRLGYLPEWERLVNPPAGELALGGAVAPNWPNCDPRNRDDVDPPHSTDMRYQRWYPSGIVLPNGMLLVYGGDDLDESVGPNLADQNKDTRDTAFRNTQVMIAVPEVFDPQTGKVTALENARKIFSLYPAATVVQFGAGKDDWKVCTLGGMPAPVSDEDLSVPRTSAVDPAADWRRYCSEEEGPGCAADTRAVRAPGARPEASVDCLDVMGALRDPNVNVPAENHWTHITTATDSHDYCCGMADMVALDERGQVTSHKWAVAGGKIPRGKAGAGRRSGNVEMIDFTDPNPTWRLQGPLYQPANGTQVVALPNGQVLVMGGAGPGGGTTAQEVYEQRENLKYQLFDPATGETRPLAKTTVPRGPLHGTVHLLPDGSVMVMGNDRDALVPRGDRIFTPGDRDLGIPVASVFYPPYLFDHENGEQMAQRPVIEHAPKYVSYKSRFAIKVGSADRISSVAIMRTGFITHTLNTDNRYVKLSFKQPANSNELVISAPAMPAHAIPGDYMLFVLNAEGVPSIAKHIRLK